MIWLYNKSYIDVRFQKQKKCACFGIQKIGHDIFLDITITQCAQLKNYELDIQS